MKRYILKKGDVLEVPLPGKTVGYVRVIGKDEFGTMFQIFKGTFTPPIDEAEFDGDRLPLEAVAYINTYAAKLAWKLRFLGKSDIEQIPKGFYGSPDRWWFVRDEGGVKKISPKEVSYDQMLADGYVHNTLWLPEDIERLLVCGEPLGWKQWRQDMNEATTNE